MAALTIPNIFFNIWFWFALIVVIIVINFFRGKSPPPPPKPSKFFAKHKKTITRITDILIICTVLLFGCLLLLYPLSIIFTALSKPQAIRAIDLQFAWPAFFTTMIVCSGFSGFFIGFLSVFQSDLSKIKRIILLIICLLPPAFTIIALLIEPTEKSWSLIKFGLTYSSICWLINGPPIIMGKHFVALSWNIMRKLRLVSGEHPG